MATATLKPKPKSPVVVAPRRRWWLIITVSIVLLVAAAAAAAYVYPRWREKRIVNRARTFIAFGDLPGAKLTALRAVQINPQNPEPVSLLVEIAEKQKSGEALYWRRR